MKTEQRVSFDCPYCGKEVEISINIPKPKVQQTKVHESNVLNYEQLHKYFPNYLSTTKAAKELRNRGIVIGQKGLFAYLRKNGYLSEDNMSYNYPTYKGRANGRIVGVWSGSRGCDPEENRFFTPHLAPGFINELEEAIKEQFHTKVCDGITNL